MRITQSTKPLMQIPVPSVVMCQSVLHEILDIFMKEINRIFSIISVEKRTEFYFHFT